MLRVFSAIFLCFSRVVPGVGRGKKSLVFWVVFLGFYLNTREWKVREGSSPHSGIALSKMPASWPTSQWISAVKMHVALRR